jgi:quercetin dioxygenase-like cupin family protein
MTKELTIHTDKTKKWFEPLPGLRIAVCVRGKDTNGSSAVIEGNFAPKSFAPLHIHKNEDELFRVLSGTLHFAAEEREFEAAAGSVVVVPRGTAHGWNNFSDREVNVMAMLVPAGFELFFEEMRDRPISDLPELAALHGCQVLTAL